MAQASVRDRVPPPSARGAPSCRRPPHLRPCTHDNKVARITLRNVRCVPPFSDSLISLRHAQASGSFGDKYDKLTLVVFALLICAVIVKMTLRDWRHEWETCDERTIMSKHEFCINSTTLELVRR